MIKDLTIEPLAIKMRTMMPKHMRVKYSGGPIFKAARASGRASQTSPNRPIVPAIKEPKAAMPNAGPARPSFAI